MVARSLTNGSPWIVLPIAIVSFDAVAEYGVKAEGYAAGASAATLAERAGLIAGGQLEVPVGTVQEAAWVARDHGVRVVLNAAPARETLRLSTPPYPGPLEFKPSWPSRQAVSLGAH